MSSTDTGMPPPPADLPPFDPFSTPEARGSVAVCAVFMFVAVAAIAARFWSRALKRVTPAIDDWLIVLGLVFYLASSVVNILQVRLGALGHHIYDVTEPERLTVGAQLGTYSQYAYALAMGFIRASICMLLYRIFITKPFRMSIAAVNIINGLWIVFSILIVSLRCRPFRANWVFELAPEACLDQVPIVLGVAIWGLIVEVAIWSLPIPMAWSLQMDRRHKIALTVIFGLGILTIGVGIARVVTILQVTATDPTWTQVMAIHWINVEPSIAIVVTCMPVCRPLLEKLIPDRLRKSLGGSSHETGSRQVKNNMSRGKPDDDIMLITRKKRSESLDAEDLEGSVEGRIQQGPTKLYEDSVRNDQIHVRRDFYVTESGPD